MNSIELVEQNIDMSYLNKSLVFSVLTALAEMGSKIPSYFRQGP